VEGIGYYSKGNKWKVYCSLIPNLSYCFFFAFVFINLLSLGLYSVPSRRFYALGIKRFRGLWGLCICLDISGLMTSRSLSCLDRWSSSFRSYLYTSIYSHCTIFSAPLHIPLPWWTGKLVRCCFFYIFVRLYYLKYWYRERGWWA